MALGVKQVFLSNFFNQDDEDNTDVIVELNNGEKYIASFFSYDQVNQLKLKNKALGDYLSGTYFFVKNLVLVENCTEKLIKKVVQDLIDEGDFWNAFEKI